MKNKKGFTLIELLAVIVILAVIALIATPLIMNVINDAKKGAARDSGYNVIKAGELKAATEGIASVEPPYHYDETSNLDMKGTKPTKFTLDINKDMDTQLKAWINGYCVVKNYGNETVTIDESKKTESACVAGSVTPPVEGPKSFATDSWSVIANAVKAGNTSVYKVGDTKEVTLTGEVAGTYTVRIANNSNPAECSGSGFSQSACGFVVEFVDIISRHRMNATNTNVGGWLASEMRTYVNNTIYNALPTDLKSVITDTKVVSSHGIVESSNFTSTDKLYLLATKEVWGKDGTSNVINNDTSDNQTRQLDYYKNKGVTTSNKAGAIKQYNGSNADWWLRSAHSSYSSIFYNVDSYGGWSDNAATITNGVAPAFRLG